VADKAGVYICHCGTNISQSVDVVELVRWASMQSHVAVARPYKFMCSSPGQELIVADIQQYGLTHIVVGACSPHMHEKTFQGACERGGINPYLMEMANIRELNSWTTDDRQAATRKAKAQVRGALERVRHHEPLEPLPVPINPNTLIVGGGIAGITAALELANGGYHVYLVEREPSIGGHMAQLDKTFPALECAACILTPRMVEAGQHPNITLLTYSEVEAVEGYLGNFRITLNKKARYVNEELCTGCANCEEKCPSKVIDDAFEAGLSQRKAIYRPYPQAVPEYPVIDAAHCLYFEHGTCRVCQLVCPNEAIDFDQKDQRLQIEAGNVIIATGYATFDPTRIPQYGYGRLPNVFTSVEFERMVNASGPTTGKIKLRNKDREPKSVAIIHCVGSRDENFNEYCSRVCCMYSLKFSHLVRERIPDAKIYNFYIDIRASGKRYEEFYRSVMKEDVNFIRGRVAEVTDTARTLEEEGKLTVQVYDTLFGTQRRIPVDMVILSVGMEARRNAREIGQLFGLGCDANNFYIERHPKLDPVLTMVEGVFIAGACQGPMAIPETVTQAAAAAGRVISFISKGIVMKEPIKASIREDQCSGCRICNNLCPYSAIGYDQEKKVSEVVTPLCQGCGTCVAACPSGAIKCAHYTRDQLMSQIEGLLWDMRNPEKVVTRPERSLP
jgi:heterodisulfide reductase subunit A2